MNPTRICPICTQTDDHPRHVIALPDGVDVARHMDCCAMVTGCPVCTAQIADANGATGDALREHLLTLPAVDLTEGA
ncbi:hypothetical protein ACH4T9_12580 [Micromonospora sp. NPDC020750]|uniref:hypothetical protein n=1 Tax=unclassified Micromonospora TaxID=2617518 RepID=UPI0037AEE516